MPLNLPPPEPWTIWSFVRLIAFAAIVFISINYSHVVAVRLIGLLGLAHAVVYVWQRKIPYGWAGHLPSGYLTGRFAVCVGLLLAAVNALLVAVPQVIIEIFKPGLK